MTGRGVLLGSTMLATMLYTIDSTVANVALPQIQGDMQATQDQIAWVLTAYITVGAICTALAGHLAHRFGLRRLLAFSVAGFTVASALCGLATSLEALVAFRIVQGACGAALVPMSQAALLATYPRERHAWVLALWGIGVMVGPVIGPVLGGYLTEWFNWRYVFFVNLPFGIAAFAGLLASAPDARAETPRQFDTLGFVLLAGAIACLQLGLDRGYGQGWLESTEILVELSCALVLGYMFVVHSLTTRQAFFDRRLFRDRNFVLGLFVIFTVGLLMLGTTTLTPLFLQQLQHYPVEAAGLVLAPRGLGTMLAMLVAGRVLLHLDGRLMAACGIALMGASCLPLANLTLDIGAPTVAWTGFLQGVGLGMVWAPLTTIAFSTLGPALRTEATVMYSLVRTIGSSIGVSLVITLLATTAQQSRSELVAWLTAFDGSRWAAFDEVAGAEGLPLIAAEVGRQAALTAYAADFEALFFASLLAAPLLLLFRRVNVAGKSPAPPD
jgi:DHA2 family multidrug resistance protein